MAMKRWPRTGGVLPGLGILPALLLFVSWAPPAVAADRQVIAEEFTNNG
jgi:hypothetical protein